MVSENDFVVHSDIKVENEDRSKLVFGQPEGGEVSKTLFYVNDILGHLSMLFSEKWQNFCTEKTLMPMQV